MKTKTIGFATLLCAVVSPLLAAPTMTVTPAGVQGGNWAWDVSITPDLTLNPDTPLAVELGFRLTGGSLLSVANINPIEFDASNPGNTIFGWEIPYAADNNHPEGIEANCAGCTVSNPVPINGGHPTTIVPGSANEIFVAMGSIDFTTPGAKSFLRITATGPGGGSPSSTLQWLGRYGVGNANGRITQLTGPFSTANFDTFSGTLTQSVPEPASVILFGICSIALALRRQRQTRVG